MTNFYKIILLVAVFGTLAYTGLVVKIGELVTNVNNYVVVFIPQELSIFFLIIGVGLMYRFYKAFSS